MRGHKYINDKWILHIWEMFAKFKVSPTTYTVKASVGAKIWCYVQQQLFKMSNSFCVETINLFAVSETCLTNIALHERFHWSHESLFQLLSNGLHNKCKGDTHVILCRLMICSFSPRPFRCPQGVRLFSISYIRSLIFKGSSGCE